MPEPTSSMNGRFFDVVNLTNYNVAVQTQNVTNMVARTLTQYGFVRFRVITYKDAYNHDRYEWFVTSYKANGRF